MLQCRNSTKPVVMRDSAQRAFAGPKRSTSADNVALAAVRWRWPMWSGFSHKNRTQRLSFSQLPEFKGVVRASGIFDSHRPLHFSLPGVSLRCPRTRLGLSSSSHSLVGFWG